jgi:hypothetical protein
VLAERHTQPRTEAQTDRGRGNIKGHQKVVSNFPLDVPVSVGEKVRRWEVKKVQRWEVLLRL